MVAPKSFAFTYGNETVFDDGLGNLYTTEDTTFSEYGSALYGINIYGDTSSPELHVGNIIYPQGIIIITSGSLTGVGREIYSSSAGLLPPPGDYWANEVNFPPFKFYNPHNLTQSPFSPTSTPNWYNTAPSTPPNLYLLGGSGIIASEATCSVSGTVPSNTTSSLLIYNDFGFEIPSMATINGIAAYANPFVDTNVDGLHPGTDTLLSSFTSVSASAGTYFATLTGSGGGFGGQVQVTLDTTTTISIWW